MKAPRGPHVCEIRHEARRRNPGIHGFAPPGGRYTPGMGCWYVYLIECRDGSLYTGIATDVDRRYAEHVAGKGARYTRSRPPVRLMARFEHPDRAAASRAEYAIKQMSPAGKRALCGLD